MPGNHTVTSIVRWLQNNILNTCKLNLKVYLDPGSKFIFVINYILNDDDQ